MRKKPLNAPIAAGVLAVLAAAACKSADIAAPPGYAHHGTGSGAVTGPDTGGNGAGTGSGLDALGKQLDGASVLDAKYEVSVLVAGIPLCKGTASLLVNVPAKPAPGVVARSPFDVKCIALSCAFGKQVNIDSLLGGLSSGAAPNQPDGSGKGGLAVDEKYLRIKGGVASTYEPALVLLPNFAGADPQFLAKMNESQHVRLTDPAAKVDASGDQHMKTLAFNATWTGHKVPGATFDKVFQFQVATDGFAGADKIKYLLFNDLEARINLNPVSLLSFGLTTKVSDLLPLLNGAGGPPPASTGECGTPPPPPPADSGGVLAGILGAAGQGSASGSGSGGFLGTIVGVLGQLISVKFDAVLLAQKGLKEALARQTEIDALLKSQTSGSGS